MTSVGRCQMCMAAGNIQRSYRILNGVKKAVSLCAACVQRANNYDRRQAIDRNAEKVGASALKPTKIKESTVREKLLEIEQILDATNKVVEPEPILVEEDPPELPEEILEPTAMLQQTEEMQPPELFELKADKETIIETRVVAVIPESYWSAEELFDALNKCNPDEIRQYVNKLDQQIQQLQRMKVLARVLIDEMRIEESNHIPPAPIKPVTNKPRGKGRQPKLVTASGKNRVTNEKKQQIEILYKAGSAKGMNIDQIIETICQQLDLTPQQVKLSITNRNLWSAK